MFTYQIGKPPLRRDRDLQTEVARVAREIQVLVGPPRLEPLRRRGVL